MCLLSRASSRIPWPQDEHGSSDSSSSSSGVTGSSSPGHTSTARMDTAPRNLGVLDYCEEDDLTCCVWSCVTFCVLVHIFLTM